MAGDGLRDPRLAALIGLTRQTDGPRLYARVEAGQIACPRCGALTRFGARHRSHRYADAEAWQPTSYDPRLQLWRCPECKLKGFLGYTLWTVADTANARQLSPPADIVPSPGEAQQLRMALSEGREAARGLGRDRRVNRVCTCGVGCVVHGRQRPTGEGDDGD